MKKSNYNFCSKIDTPPVFGEKQKKAFNKKKSYKSPATSSKKGRKTRTKYAIKKSNQRKPFLNPAKHVRKYNPTRPYKRNCRCFICGDENHLANVCPKKESKHIAKANIIKDVNTILVNVDEDTLDTESIWSIEEFEVLRSDISSDDNSSDSESEDKHSWDMYDVDHDHEDMYENMFKEYMKNAPA